MLESLASPFPGRDSAKKKQQQQKLSLDIIIKGKTKTSFFCKDIFKAKG